ncbi:Acg family FMN-binding oxidoreductase [Roseomonas sp. AR75]|uniref:Acg family FMN-binding oxidoreductase n=1 Tax=Roseomonas sp. AR75 TaxID=2562311 RepID=UPI0010C0AF22|nr:nitroreductase family protein [Roseomonas sp. AR75]
MDGPRQDDPWAVEPGAFAGCTDPADRLRFLLTYAVLAPSSHNTQPWRFRLHGGARLDLLADRERALPVVDPDDRELTISCGAALANLRCAAAALGEALEVAALPDPAEPDLLARITARGPCPPAARMARLLRAITARHTSRQAFEPEPVPATLREEAIAAAEQDGDTWLHWVESPAQRQAIARLVAEGDRVQMADPAFRQELARWIRSRHSGTQDGISAAGFGLPDLLSGGMALLLRRFDLGDGQAARDAALAEGAPALAVLATPGDTPRDWLAAGEALERMLLTLTAGGLSASYLNQAVEVPALRLRLAATVGAAVPQLLLRIGRGERPSPSARRPVAAVLDET